MCLDNFQGVVCLNWSGCGLNKHWVDASTRSVFLVHSVFYVQALIGPATSHKRLGFGFRDNYLKSSTQLLQKKNDTDMNIKGNVLILWLILYLIHSF